MWLQGIALAQEMNSGDEWMNTQTHKVYLKGKLKLITNTVVEDHEKECVTKIK